MNNNSEEQRKKHLKEMLNMPLSYKFQKAIATIDRFIIERGGVDKVYISFSGGKDSCVLLHIARLLYPEIKAMYVNTGLEYPEINDFIKTVDNIDIVRPALSFKQVVEKYGFPTISKEISQQVNEFHNLTKGCKTQLKRETQLINTKWSPFLSTSAPKISDRCCHKLKKNPAKKYEKETGRSPITGVMLTESRLRRQQYLRQGCVAFSSGRHQAKPLSLWTEENVWEYIKLNNLEISKIYNEPEIDRTGCVFCLFGAHMDKAKRLVALKRLHPKLFEYSFYKLGMGEALSYMYEQCNIKFEDEIIKEIKKLKKY